jgi:hypothetical protein
MLSFTLWAEFHRGTYCVEGTLEVAGLEELWALGRRQQN